MILVTVEFLLLGQQLHIRQVALLHRHGTQLAKENAPRTAPMAAGFQNRSAPPVINPCSASRYILRSSKVAFSVD